MYSGCEIGNDRTQENIGRGIGRIIIARKSEGISAQTITVIYIFLLYWIWSEEDFQEWCSKLFNMFKMTIN